jgi:uncharacterized repeat protein (TIGR01451 family)
LTIAGRGYTVWQAGAGPGPACTASVSSPPQVALEGRTEALGDLVLACSGLNSALNATIRLTLNTNVTNRLTGSATDATLSVNGASPVNGQIAGYGTLVWPGVTLPAGAPTIRIAGVRADASLVGFAANLQVPSITGDVKVDALVPVPLAGARQTMANVNPTLVFQKQQATPPTGGAQTIIPLAYQEAALTAFHASAGSTPATRVRLALTNVPSTVQVYAPVHPGDGTQKAQLYSADAAGAGGAPVAGTVMAGALYQQLTVSGGAATATWVVSAADPLQLETLTFPLLVTNAGANDLNQIQVGGSFAPASDVGVASETAPVPRYRDFSVPQKLVNLRVSTTLQTGTASALVKAGGFALAASSANAAGVAAGSNVTFVTQVVNDTSDPSQAATGVVVRDNLPSGLNFVSCTASGGVSCGGSGQTVHAHYGTLSPGESQTVTVVARVDPSVSDGTVIGNPVSASSDQVDADLPATASDTSFIVLNGTPVAVGSQPSSGSGTSQSFVFQFSHPGGWQNLGVVNILINNALDGRHGCYLAYVVSSSTLYLVNDAGDAGGPYAGGLVLGSTGSIQNSQCGVALSSATGSGNTLTVTLSLAFTAEFGGNHILYVAARDQGGNNSNWQALGVWQVPWTAAGTIGVAGANPARGAGAAGAPQSLAFTLSDSQGTPDLGVVNVLINDFVDGRHACYLAFVVATNTLYLVDDAGNAGGPFAGGMALNGTGGIQNSQCQVAGAGSSAAFNGNNMTLTLRLTFSAGFRGNRILYVAGRDRAERNNTDWQAMGTWTVQ